MVDDRVTRFVWLRQFEVGGNSAAAVRLLERLEFLQTIDLSPVVLTDIPPHRVTRLRRQGERYFADGLRDISGDRRLAILAVCVVEWKAAIADAVVETHDRIVGKTWREAKQLSDARIDDAKTVLPRILRTFTGLGTALLEAQNDGASLEHAVLSGPGWSGLRDLVEAATRLTDAMSVDPLGHVVRGYVTGHRLRKRSLAARLRYAPPTIQLGPEGVHALTFNPDQSMGAGQTGSMREASSLLMVDVYLGGGGVHRLSQALRREAVSVA